MSDAIMYQAAFNGVIILVNAEYIYHLIQKKLDRMEELIIGLYEDDDRQESEETKP